MSYCHLGDLPPNQRWIVEAMHKRSFGRFLNLVVRNGEPVIDPPPTIITTWKFGAQDNGPRPEARLANYALKGQFLELFRVFDSLRNGVIDVLEFQHGTPFRMELTEQLNKSSN